MPWTNLDNINGSPVNMPDAPKPGGWYGANAQTYAGGENAGQQWQDKFQNGQINPQTLALLRQRGFNGEAFQTSSDPYANSADQTPMGQQTGFTDDLSKWLEANGITSQTQRDGQNWKQQFMDSAGNPFGDPTITDAGMNDKAMMMAAAIGLGGYGAMAMGGVGAAGGYGGFSPELMQTGYQGFGADALAGLSAGNLADASGFSADASGMGSAPSFGAGADATGVGSGIGASAGMGNPATYEGFSALGGFGGASGGGGIGGALGGLSDWAGSNPGLVNVAGGLVNGLIGQRSASNALDASRGMYDQTRADYAPYRQTGYNALGKLNGLMQDPSSIKNDPGYQFGMDQGKQAIDRSAASKGNLYSGATLKALSRYGQDYAGTKLNDAYARYGNAAQLGATGVNGSAQANQNYGSDAGNAALYSGNIWQNGLNNALGNFNYSTYRKPG